jgi:hypothetical protein
VTSATYRQSAQGKPDSAKLDPDNALVSRWKSRRLEAEAVRDSMLAVSGELDRTPGGVPDADEQKSLRRGIYLLMKRQKPPAGLTLFDGPTSATESCPKRVHTATPLHALFLLNNPFPAERAKAFAERVRKLAGDEHARQVDVAFALALARKPKDKELEAVTKLFLNAPEEAEALVTLCHALLCTNEFTTLE